MGLLHRNSEYGSDLSDDPKARAFRLWVKERLYRFNYVSMLFISHASYPTVKRLNYVPGSASCPFLSGCFVTAGAGRKEGETARDVRTRDGRLRASAGWVPKLATASDAAKGRAMLDRQMRYRYCRMYSTRGEVIFSKQQDVYAWALGLLDRRPQLPKTGIGRAKPQEDVSVRLHAVWRRIYLAVSVPTSLQSRFNRAAKGEHSFAMNPWESTSFAMVKMCLCISKRQTRTGPFANPVNSIGV